MRLLPTLADIARRSGVSTYTASLALRDNPRVAQLTRTHVREIARQLGYRPNPLISALMTRVRLRRGRQTGFALGFIVCRETAAHPGQLDYQKLLLAGAAARARELGYRLDPIRLTSVHGRGRRLQHVIDARGIHGLIVGPVAARDFKLDLSWDRLACVTIGHSFAEVPIHRVTHNQYRSLRLVFDLCRERGWQRPGVLLSRRVLEAVDQGFLGGYLTGSYMQTRRIVVPPLLYDDAHFDRETLVAWVKKHRVDAILTLRHDTHAWLREAGYRVGCDLGLVMLDRTESDHNISGIDQHHFEMGEAASEVLAQAMQNSHFGIPMLPRIVGLDGVWHEGKTLPSRKNG